ncbi:MAG: hypothetical protein ACI3ZQ_04895 [Candidatus Cryptobacteroides sp.]
MKTLLKIEVDERGFGRNAFQVNSKEEQMQLIGSLLSMIVISEEFRSIMTTALDTYYEHTAEVTKAVEKHFKEVPSSVFYNNDNKHNS